MAHPLTGRWECDINGFPGRTYGHTVRDRSGARPAIAWRPVLAKTRERRHHTFGAVGGAALAGFSLLPGLGLHRSLWLGAAVNIGIGFLAIGFDRSLQRRTSGAAPAMPRAMERASAPESPASAPPRAAAVLILLVFGTSGAASMMYEVGWTRALSLVLGSSTYAFTTMLVAFLGGLAAGSALFARWWGGRPLPVWSPGLIQLGIGLSAAMVLPFFDRLPELFLAVFRITQNPRAIVVAQFLLGAGVMLVPTLFMGATFNQGDFLLVGSRQPLLLDPNRLRARFDASAGVRQDLGLLGMSDPLSILVDFSLGNQDLDRLAKGGRLKTDDRPLLEFSAPLSLYRQTVQRNNALVDRTRTRGLPPLTPEADPRLFEQPAFLANIALAHMRKGQAIPAKRYLDAALSIDSRHLLALILRGQVNRELGHPFQAEADLLRVASLDPEPIGAYRELGRLYIQQGMLERAEAAFRRMQKLMPGVAEPHLHLAQVYLNLRQWEKAKAEAERAATLAPTDVTAWNLSAQAYSGLEDWRAATRALSQGLALSPRNPALLEQLGKAAAQLGDWTGAERSLRAVLQITPRALEPRLALARVYFQSGNRARALQELEVAMRFYPDKDELREAHEATRTAPLPSGTPQRSDGTGKMP